MGFLGGGGVGALERRKKSSTKAAKPYPLDLSRHDFQNRKTLSLDLTADSQIALSLQPFSFRARKLSDHHLLKLFHLLFKVGKSHH